MNEDILVSIIIPAYNVEAYLDDCMKSVLNQTHKNLQIILVDDGSKDSTGKMCDEYSNRDNRIQVIHKENGGQAIARNLALTYVKGDYVLYVDSDDVIADNYVEVMVDVARKNNIDVVNCALQKFIDASEIQSKPYAESDVKIYSRQDALETLLYQRVFNQNPSSKLLSRKIAVETPFPEGKIFEDMATVYRWFDKSEKIVYIDNPFYLYRQRSGSIMHSSFSDKKFDRVEVTSIMRGFITEKYPSIVNAMNARWLLSNLQVLMELPFDKAYSDRRKEIFSNIKEVRKQVISDKKVKKSLRIMAASTFLGATITMLEGRVYNYVVNRNK